MTSIYKYRTYQYIGPSLDQNLYAEPFLLQQGTIVEAPNIQWITDPTAECTPEQKRIRIRVPQSTKPRPNITAYQYRPFL